MIDIAFDIALVALQMCLGVSRIFGQRLFVVTHAVRFDVRFGHEVNAVAVAEVVPARIVRVMACAHGVEIVLFQNANVLDHALQRYNISAVGIHFVTIGAFEQDGFSVDEQLTVFDLHLAKTRMQRDDLDSISGGILQCHGYGIKYRRFGRPKRYLPGVK